MPSSLDKTAIVQQIASLLAKLFETDASNPAPGANAFAAATAAPANAPNLTDAQRRICIRVVNAFETGKIAGDYAAISIYHDGPSQIRQVTYGRSQTTEYGNLRELIHDYVAANGSFSADLAPYVEKIGTKIGTPPGSPLVDDQAFLALLRSAGADPVMRRTQDAFFDRVYFQPALNWASQHEFGKALSVLVIYDSFIHSGGVLAFLRSAVAEPTPANGGVEKTWIAEYLAVRQHWLANNANPQLRDTIYRTKDLTREVDRNNWDLAITPILANGVPVDGAPDRPPATAAALVGDLAAFSSAAPAGNFAVRHGHRYAADIGLTGFEILASNAQVAAALESRGFIDVVVTGSGSGRHGEATWGGADAVGSIDPHLTNVREIDAAAVAAARIAAPAIVGATSMRPMFGAPGNAFSTAGLPKYQPALLAVRMRPEAMIEAPPGAPGEGLPAAAMAAAAAREEPTTAGMSALSFFDRAGKVKRVTPLRAHAHARGPAPRMAAAAALTFAPKRAKPLDVADGVSFIELHADEDIDQLHREMAKDPGVAEVSRVAARYLLGGPPSPAVAPAPEPPPLWNLSQIRWREARSGDGFQDADEVRVAVLDTGVDQGHPNLAVDDYQWSHPDVSASLSSKDNHGHGTHVSGIISALLKGASPVRGVCKCRLTVHKIFTDDAAYISQLGYYIYVVDSRLYQRALAACVDDPVDVINLSIGGPQEPDQFEQPLFDQLLGAGTIICAAMGNDRMYGSPKSYPAAIPGVIAVGATTIDDSLAQFSNGGDHIALAAPGAAIWSTLPTYPGQQGFAAQRAADGTPRPGAPMSRATNFAAWDGTSMAAPHVSAAAALLVARNHATANRLDPRQVKAMLMASADAVAAMNGEKFSIDFGAGRLNLSRLLQ